MYDDENHKHYDFFDYLDGEGHKRQYEPDSDMDYLGFRELHILTFQLPIYIT